MNATLDCPTPEALRRLMSGLADEEAIDRFAHHLAGCPHCTQAIRELGQDDPLLAALRTACVKAAEEDEPHVAELIETLRLLRHDAALGTQELDQDLVETPLPNPADETLSEVDQVADELDCFLGARRHEDELGVLGSFVVRRILGAGGMGIVVAAEDVQLSRPVAIKVMRRTLARSAGSKERFLREARAMAALDHDHVVPIYQVGQERGVPYFAMPLLKGESVETKLRRQGRLTTQEVVQLGKETALGLAAAHARQLIHRDIKPGNIWWEPRQADAAHQGDATPARDQPRSRVKLLDFGLVRAAEESGALTATGLIAGTPAYMAPEQARGEKVDERTDLFSLGCVMYQALTGQRPFGGDNPTAMLWAVTNSPPQRVLELNADVPPRLALLIERLLEKDPARRFQTATELAAELSEIESALHRAHERAAPSQTAAQPARRSGSFGGSQGSARRRITFVLVGLGALLLGLAAWAVVTLRLRSDRGTVVVEWDDRDVQEATLSIDGVQKLSIQSVPDAEADPTPSPDVSQPVEVQAPARDGLSIGVAAALSGVIPGILPSPSPLPGLRRWQLETKAPRGDIRSVAWSPDGSQVACGTALGHLRIYDVPRGALRLLVAAHRGNVLAIDWSRDGQWLVSGGADKRALLWRPDGTAGPALAGHEGWVHALAFRPDSQALATAADSHIRLWDLNGKQLAVLDQHSGMMVDLDWSPDGKQVASANGDGTASIWSDAGELVAKLVPQRDWGWTTAVAWSPDGQSLVTGGADRSIHFWTRQGELLRQLHNESWVHGLSWSKHGLVAAAGENGTIRVWDGAGQLQWEEPTRLGRLEDIAWTADGERLAAGGGGAAIHVRDRQGDKVADLVSDGAALTTVAWSAAGRIAVSGRGHPRLWVLTEEGKLDCLLEGHTAPVLATSFNSAGRLLASGGWDGRVHIWNLDTGTKTRVDGGNPVAWNPQGDELAYGLRQEVRLWTPTGDRLLLQLTGNVSALAWAANGSELTTGDDDGRVQRWNRDGELLAEQKVPSTVTSLAWHPTRELLASANTSELSVRLWNRELQPIANWPGHAVNVVCVQWSPDGQRLGSGGGDGWLRIWDVEGNTMHALQPPAGMMHGVCFSPDGRYVVGVGSEGTLTTYRVDTGEPGFVFLPLRGNQWLTLSANGTVIDGDFSVLQDALVVLAETEDGQRAASAVGQVIDVTAAEARRRPKR